MYRVIRRRTALGRLADLWMEAVDRDAVDAAVWEIDRVLTSAPLSSGESRNGGRRILIARPLAVYFEVDHVNRIASILTIWKMDRSRENQAPPPGSRGVSMLRTR